MNRFNVQTPKAIKFLRFFAGPSLNWREHFVILSQKKKLIIFDIVLPKNLHKLVYNFCSTKEIYFLPKARLLMLVRKGVLILPIVICDSSTQVNEFIG